MESVGVSQFRQRLPFFMKKVKNGATIAITSRGRVVARLDAQELLVDPFSPANHAVAGNP